MATRTLTVLICDLCGREDETVTTHTLTIDGEPFEVEACERDWAKVRKGTDLVAASGRRLRGGRKKTSAK